MKFTTLSLLMLVASVAHGTSLPVDPTELQETPETNLRGPGIHRETTASKCTPGCNGEYDCASGLICLFRGSINKYQTVPGCPNVGQNLPSTNYCVDPDDLDEDDLYYIAGKNDHEFLYPLSKCKGHCYNDQDCGSLLKCYEGDAPVPGCTGSYDSGIHYCIENTAGAPVPGPTNGFPGRCEPGCKYASDCSNGLICLWLESINQYDFVPGCPHLNPFQKGNYCVHPNDLPAKQLFYTADDGDHEFLYPLEECRGDCDEDTDCKGALRCYTQTSTVVPGCFGTADRVNYCYDVANANLGAAPNAPELTYSHVDLNLATCQGGCVEHSDCRINHACFRRDEFNRDHPVPGCGGIAASDHTNYCVDAAAVSKTTNSYLKVWSAGYPPSLYPFGKCQGPCSSNSDCFGTLTCTKSGTSLDIPTCIGDAHRNVGYCI